MSLLESLTAVVIVSALVLIATPALIETRDAYVLKSAARDVASAMHSARIAAIMDNRDCRLRVAAPVSYVVECEYDGQDGGADGWETRSTATMPKGMTVTANARPEFHRRGNVAPTGTVSVWNSKGRQLRIVVNVNGRIRIE